MGVHPLRPSRVRKAVHKAWQLALHLHFLGFQRHRHNRVALEHVAGRPILVLPQVMNPVLFRTGEFLACTLSSRLIPPGSTVLDMGTGSGICAVCAAQWAHRVVAVDINPAAVRCARINVLLNQWEERVEVRAGDLFAPVQGERFDVVLFNPPYLQGEPRTDFERALWTTDVIERFAARLEEFLAVNGSAFVLLSTISDEANHLELFCRNGFVVDGVARRHWIGEVLTVYRLQPQPFA